MGTQIAYSKLFELAFEYAPIGITLTDLNGGFINVNSKLCDITGYSKEELISKTFIDITHPDDLEKDVEQMNRCLAGQIWHYGMEKRYIHKSGTEVWIYLNKSLVRNETKVPQFFITHVEDIGERKMAERQLLQKNQELKKMNDLMIGRELKMVELKRQLKLARGK